MNVNIINSAFIIKSPLHHFNPTKYLCILGPAPFVSLYRSGADFAVFCCYLGQICIKFGANLASKF